MHPYLNQRQICLPRPARLQGCSSIDWDDISSFRLEAEERIDIGGGLVDGMGSLKLLRSLIAVAVAHVRLILDGTARWRGILRAIL